MNVIMVFLIVIIELNEGTLNDEQSWSHFYGNPSNSRRLIPSLPTNFTRKSWLFSYMSSAQDIAIQGTAVGINGDLYLFVSQNRNNAGYSRNLIILIFHYYCRCLFF